MSLEVALGAVGYRKPTKRSWKQQAEDAATQAEVNETNRLNERREHNNYKKTHHVPDTWVVIIAAVLMLAAVVGR